MSFPLPSIPGLNDNKAELYEKDNPSSKVVFQFNPETISFSKSTSWRQGNTGAADGPILEYASTSPLQVSSINLLLDGTAPTGLSFSKVKIDKQVGQLMDWMNPGEDSRTRTSATPPLLVFNWGKLKLGPYKQLECQLTSLSVNYTLFSRDGEALRAECTVGIQSVRTIDPRTNPTSGGPEPVRSYTAQRDDALPLVSHREYGKTSGWRSIAEYNDVDNPFRVRPGRTMLLPEMRAT